MTEHEDMGPDYDEMMDDTADLAVNLLEELHDLPEEQEIKVPVSLIRALCAGYLCLFEEVGGELDEETIH